MARIYPCTVPPDTSSQAEVDLFGALSEQLGGDWTVIHSLPWLDDGSRNLREGECDFVVLHPAKGLLALEAKSGSVSYVARTKSWLLNGRMTIQDPYLQAERSAHHLNNVLKKRVPVWNNRRPPFGHAAAFPHSQTLPGDFPIHVRPEITLLENDIRRLPEALDFVLHRFGQMDDAFTAIEMEQVINALLPEFRIVESLPGMLKRGDRTLYRLTCQQAQALEMMHRNRRLLVEGCAGSGKTMLAIERAMGLAREGARVLLLCYNNALADAIQERIRSQDCDVEALTFHGLCQQIVESTGGVFDVPEDHESRAEFFNVTSTQMLLDALPRYERRYDAIIVDEGQDFVSLWWIAIESLLSDASHGYFIVFVDPRQNIYRREVELPFAGPVMDLRMNCRNSRNIARWLHQFIEFAGDSYNLLPEGREPEFIKVLDEREEREAVRKALHHLVNEEKLKVNQIILLGRHTLGRSSFAKQRHLGNFEIVELDHAEAPHHVRYSTIHTFKGLEADCVLLTGVGAPTESLSEEQCRTLVYVGASRAKHLLYVFHRPGAFG